MQHASEIITFLNTPAVTLSNTITGLAKLHPNSNEQFLFTMNRSCSNWITINIDDINRMIKIGVDMCSNGQKFHLVRLHLKINSDNFDNLMGQILATR